MSVFIGSARIDERGRLSGGLAGDQKQTSIPDRKGEVSIQAFYEHKKGWYILRPKDRNVAKGIADAMIRACNNVYIGYDQLLRLGIIKYGTRTKTPTGCDCSSLIRQCIIEASGKDVGNFTTANEAQTLIGSRLFDRIPYNPGTPLFEGDVLVTKTKGHTVAVTEVDVDFPTLHKGSTGPYVKELQTLLKYGYNFNIEIDSIFGNETMGAVKAFQKLKGLVQDGICGPKTWAALKR